MKNTVLLSATVVALSSLFLTVAPAHAADGPAGLYVLDVDATMSGLAESGQDTPDSRQMLESMAAHTGMKFEDDYLYVLTTPDTNGETFGSCAFRMDEDVVALSDCQSPKPDEPFTFVGDVFYDYDSDAIAVAMPGGGPLMIYFPK